MNSKNLVNRWQDLGFVANASTCLEQLMVNKLPSSGLDLRGVVVGLQGQVQQVRDHDFYETLLKDSDLSFGKFSCSFSQCRWTSVMLEGGEFDTCDFRASNFENCSLVKARIDSPTFDDCIFTECVFDDAIISGRGFNEYGGRRVLFVRCRFTRTTFKNLQFRACRFIDCEYSESSFRRCLLAGTQFNGAAPSSNSFVECELTQCTSNGEPISLASNMKGK